MGFGSSFSKAFNPAFQQTWRSTEDQANRDRDFALRKAEADQLAQLRGLQIDELRRTLTNNRNVDAATRDLQQLYTNGAMAPGSNQTGLPDATVGAAHAGNVQGYGSGQAAVGALAGDYQREAARMGLEGGPQYNGAAGGDVKFQPATQAQLMRGVGGLALAKGDMQGFTQALAGEKAAKGDELMSGAMAQWQQMTPEQKAAWAKQNSYDQKLPMYGSYTAGTPDAVQGKGASKGTKGGKPTPQEGFGIILTDNGSVHKLTDAEMGQLFAAQQMMQHDPARATQIMVQGSEKLRKLYQDAFNNGAKIEEVTNGRMTATAALRNSEAHMASVGLQRQRMEQERQKVEGVEPYFVRRPDGSTGIEYRGIRYGKTGEPQSVVVPMGDGLRVRDMDPTKIEKLTKDMVGQPTGRLDSKGKPELYTTETAYPAARELVLNSALGGGQGGLPANGAPEPRTPRGAPPVSRPSGPAYGSPDEQMLRLRGLIGAPTPGAATTPFFPGANYNAQR